MDLILTREDRVRSAAEGSVAAAVREWQSTAAIHADPTLADRLSGPLNDDSGPVPAPAGS
ncbi:hypothetical protein ABTZ99_02775 [Actinosynnema sp. NPDC002837]